MGKGHSKHGQCYLVNAHFNPLCQLEDSNSIHSVETPLTSKDSGLQLTPEISFTLSDDNKTNSNKDAKKCALEVFLPEESVAASIENPAMDVKIRNPCSESLNEDQQITLECVQNNKSEKQEFSFVLRNCAAVQESGKDDIEKIVLRSICDVLKTTLKLPPSGTHTLKVHLIVSPDNEKNSALQNQSNEKSNTTETCQCDDSKYSNVHNTSCQSAQFDFTTPDAVSGSAKQSNTFIGCCQDSYVNPVQQYVEAEKKFEPFSSPHCEKKSETFSSPHCEKKSEAFSSPRCKRNRLLAHKKEARRWTDATEAAIKDKITNIKCSPRSSTARERRHQHSAERHNIGDCSHYLDLAELKISDLKEPNVDMSNKCDLRYLNPAYCSPRHSEKGNIFCGSHKQNYEFQNSYNLKKSDAQRRLYEADLHSGILRYKLLNKTKNDHIDLGFDVCDMEDKQENNELHTQHRRSRSYDTNQYSFVNSPKFKHRNCSCVKCGTSLPHHSTVVPPSPSRHHRHRHKEREKDKLRAMQQVARWLEREDLSHNKQHRHSESWADIESCSQKNTVVERHEYHHIHEHHHYYHYVES